MPENAHRPHENRVVSAPELATSGALQRFQTAFTAYIRDPEHATPPPEVALDRMRLYAELVFGNVERVMGNMFPVLKQLTPSAHWHDLVRTFFRDYALHDPLFATMPEEFVKYLQARTTGPEDAPFLLELAHYEWVDYALSVDEAEIDLTGIDGDGDFLAGHPALNPLVWMLQYVYPVQRFRDEPPVTAPPAAPTYLVAYRDCEDRVGYFELNAVSARLIELIDEHPACSGHALLELLAGELTQEANDVFMAAGRDTLTQFRAKDIVLGTRLR